MSQFFSISAIVLDISRSPQICMYTLCGQCVQLLGGAKIIIRLAIMVKITRILSQCQYPVHSACASDSEVVAAQCRHYATT